MAIQEIEVSKKGDESIGFKREIHEGAMGLVLDTIQITQYTKPEESTVRELAANAVDSQREKEIAISILEGESKPEDHFIKREGAKFDDSNWDASYYDIKHLNRAKDRVELIYQEHEGTGRCDRFIVRDHGVGLGGERLKGYFQIGYSTKRNSKGTLGAFGFGNKVALSTRCEFYTVTTVHNGKKFKFNCYSYKIDSLIGKFNTITKQTNKNIKFVDADGNETIINYEETNEKNYTEISVPVKRLHRNKYEAAVKNQLLYFNNVDFKIISEDGYERDIDVMANVMYNSKRLLISQNSRFSKPHIVIVKGDDDGNGTGVCYGYIDFPELEMEQLYGNVGVKCPIRSVIRDDKTGVETVLQEGVEVTPSREAVVWSEHTRNFIKKIFSEAVEEATNIVQEQLNEDDFIKWLIACKDVMHRAGRHSVLGELKQVVDTASIKPKFGKTGIKFGYPSTMFKGCKVRINRTGYNTKKKVSEIMRDEVVSWDSLDIEKVYFKTQNSSPTKDAYIESINGGFITIEKLSDEALEKVHRDTEKNKDSKLFMEEDKFKELLKTRDTIVATLLTSKYIKNYDDVKVPDNFKVNFDEEQEEAKVNNMTAAERRKLNQQIVINYLVPKNSIGWNQDKAFTWKQSDTKVIDIQSDPAKIVYGFNADDAMMHLAAMLIRNQVGNKEMYPDDKSRMYHQSYQHDEKYNVAYFNDEFKLIKINKTNEKYFKGRDNCIHISDFFQKTESIDG